MKNFKMIIMAVFALLVTVGCSSDNGGNGNVQESNSNATAREVMTHIQEVMGEEYGLAMEDGVLSGYHIMDLKSEEDTQAFFLAEHFDLADIREGYILEPMMSMVRSELVIVIEANDTSGVEGVREAFEHIREAQEATWSQYLPDQYAFVQDNQIVTHGDFVLYATSEHVEEIVAAFEAKVR